MPDKIDVKTGEEEEEVLYSHRAKLFRFNDSQWKERGLGDVKILQHKQHGRMRVVMRREQILKICLNHVLDRDVEYKRKDDKSWHFVVNDFSEGELSLEQLCLRFKTEEIATEFRKAIDDALNGITSKQNGGSHHENDSQKVSLQSKLSAEESKKINDLKLPANFFEYKNFENCSGCRGCNPEEFQFPEVKANNVCTLDENPLPLVFKPINISKVAEDVKPTANIFSSMNKSFGGVSQNSGSFLFGSANWSGGDAAKEKGVAPAATQSFIFGSSTTPKLPSANIFGGNSVTTSSDSTATKTETPKTQSFSFGGSPMFVGKLIVRKNIENFVCLYPNMYIFITLGQSNAGLTSTKSIFGGSANASPSFGSLAAATTNQSVDTKQGMYY